MVYFWISFVVLIALLILGLPIYLSLLVSGIIILMNLGVASKFIISALFEGVAKFTLLAVPLFLLAGCLIEKTAFSDNIVKYTYGITKKIKGSGAIAAIIANGFFGAVSGSSAAATGVIGKVFFPILSKVEGEDKALGLLTSAGAIAIVMPPSITMILYASVVGVSTGTLFLAGIIPAIIICVAMAIYTQFISKNKTVPAAAQTDNEDSEIKGTKKFAVLKEIFVAATVIFLPVVVLGGIYLGYYTPTEAAAIAIIYVLVVSLFVYKDLTWKIIISALQESLILTSKIFIVIAASTVFSRALTVAQVPQQLVNVTEGLSPIVFLIIVNIVLLFVGMFFDPASAVVVIAPILLPVAQVLNINLIHLGIVMTINIAIGMFTPPFGLNLFVSQAVFKKEFSQIVISTIPFLIIYLIVLAIITFLPGVYMWMPGVL